MGDSPGSSWSLNGASLDGWHNQPAPDSGNAWNLTWEMPPHGNEMMRLVTDARAEHAHGSRDLVLCSDGPVALDAEQASQLHRWGVVVRQEKVAAILGGAGRMRIAFENGSSLERTALFIQPSRRPGSELPARLGCELDGDGCVAVDQEGRTSIPGIYAAGDGAAQQLVVAAAAGATAAMSIQKDLITHDFD